MRPQISDKEFSNYAYVNPTGSRYGVPLCDWGNTETGAPFGTYAVVDPGTVVTNPEESPTSLLKMTQNATFSMYQVQATGATIQPVKLLDTIGFWYLAPDLAGPRPVELRVYATGGARLTRGNFIVEPTSTWKFVTVQRQQMGENTIVLSDTIANIRLTQQDSATSFPTNWDDWQTGEVVYFGAVYMNPRTRSKFMLAVDDVTNNILDNGSGYPTGYPTSGGNYKDIFDFYGFSGTIYVASSFIGGVGYATWDQVRTMRDAGWTIGSISRDHPNDGSNRGLMLDGPYNGGTVAAIIDDIQSGIDAMIAENVGEDAYHFGLPGGGWDSYVRDAVLSLPIKTIRGTSLFNNGCHPIPTGLTSGGNNSSSTMRLSGWITMPASLSLSSATNAQMDAFLDEVIAIGATGMGHTHGINASVATKVDYMCSILKTKQNQGLIDVVNVKDWYENQ